jgi:hypothetical protein
VRPDPLTSLSLSDHQLILHLPLLLSSPLHIFVVIVACIAASDIAENPYYLRDFRRQYPKLEVVTQDELAQLLLSQPDQLGYVRATFFA